ncbi:dihydrofolate reductase family protein [Brevibacterium sp.]|uniref:dihydrofolate reductase family protein n=1 Tax=Brevibacterium sp. TaxID=1701 RepID=UPI0028112FA9|nr:dihydrofolate reductase family protein [Brevibacterium sp.]
MGTLSYTASISLDGYVADATGDFQWSAPSEDVFRFHVDRMTGVSTEVLGRNTYLLMKYWETDPDDGSWGAAEHEFARRWRQLDKVVASTTLSHDDLATDRARLVNDLGLTELEQIASDATGEVEIFGPATASAAIRAGLVIDFRFFVVPTMVGGGLSAIPADVHLDLKLVEHCVFDSGTAFLHYQLR